MTRLSCPSCRLRFTAAVAANLTTCPECGRDVQAVDSASSMLGYRLFEATDPEPALPMAIEAALPLDGPRPDQA
jgi:hypothetical protein